MDVELREALDHGFGHEPPHRPVVDRLEAGHHAVRRRRLAGMVVAVACATAVGIGAATLSGAGDQAPQVADTQKPSDPNPSVDDVWDGELARYDDTGHVELRPGVTVLRRIDEPYGDSSETRHSVALALEFQGAESWLMLTWEESADGSSASGSGAGAFPEGSFDEWVEQNVSANEDDSAGYIRFAEDGSLVSSHGVEILDQVHPVELKDVVVGEGATAAALLQGPDGKKWYVLVREAEEPRVTAVPFRTGGTDLEAFLLFVHERLWSGQGLP
jgi:hypothetical protein